MLDNRQLFLGYVTITFRLATKVCSSPSNIRVFGPVALRYTTTDTSPFVRKAARMRKLDGLPRVCTAVSDSPCPAAGSDHTRSGLRRRRYRRRGGGRCAFATFSPAATFSVTRAPVLVTFPHAGPG